MLRGIRGKRALIKKEEPEPSKKIEGPREQRVFYRIVRKNEERSVFATHTYYTSQKDANNVLFDNVKEALARQNRLEKEEFPMEDVQHGTNDRGNFCVKYIWVS